MDIHYYYYYNYALQQSGCKRNANKINKSIVCFVV